ncbi:hypothetical protein LSAT2_020083 [Lamellibrachia satsuma]|nr:hypothetical protein LSAT2_020083 [Lamellibrachia satsuma]
MNMFRWTFGQNSMRDIPKKSTVASKNHKVVVRTPSTSANGSLNTKDIPRAVTDPVIELVLRELSASLRTKAIPPINMRTTIQVRQSTRSRYPEDTGLAILRIQVSLSRGYRSRYPEDTGLAIPRTQVSLSRGYRSRYPEDTGLAIPRIQVSLSRGYRSRYPEDTGLAILRIQDVIRYDYATTLLPQDVIPHDYATTLLPQDVIRHDYATTLLPQDEIRHDYATTLLPQDVILHDYATTLLPQDDEIRHDYATTLLPQDVILHDYATTLLPQDVILHDYATTLLPQDVILHDYATTLLPQDVILHDYATTLLPQDVILHDYATTLLPQDVILHDYATTLLPQDVILHDYATTLLPQDVILHDYATTLLPQDVILHDYATTLLPQDVILHDYATTLLPQDVILHDYATTLLPQDVILHDYATTLLPQDVILHDYATTLLPQDVILHDYATSLLPQDVILHDYATTLLPQDVILHDYATTLLPQNVIRSPASLARSKQLAHWKSTNKDEGATHLLQENTALHPAANDQRQTHRAQGRKPVQFFPSRTALASRNDNVTFAKSGLFATMCCACTVIVKTILILNNIILMLAGLATIVGATYLVKHFISGDVPRLVEDLPQPAVFDGFLSRWGIADTTQRKGETHNTETLNAIIRIGVNLVSGLGVCLLLLGLIGCVSSSTNSSTCDIVYIVCLVVTISGCLYVQDVFKSGKAVDLLEDKLKEKILPKYKGARFYDFDSLAVNYYMVKVSSNRIRLDLSCDIETLHLKASRLLFSQLKHTEKTRSKSSWRLGYVKGKWGST